MSARVKYSCSDTEMSAYSRLPRWTINVQSSSRICSFTGQQRYQQFFGGSYNNKNNNSSCKSCTIIAYSSIYCLAIGLRDSLEITLQQYEPDKKTGFLTKTHIGRLREYKEVIRRYATHLCSTARFDQSIIRILALTWPTTPTGEKIVRVIISSTAQ